MRTRPITLSTIAIALTISLPAACAEPPQPAEALQKSFVWVPSAPMGKQVYAVFRKTLELREQPQAAVLRLFADSRYILWINGKYVDRGPCRFDPIRPEYDTIDVTKLLRPGANVLAVLVHHYHDGKPQACGDSMCGRIMRHASGLTAALEWTDASDSVRTITTDATWRVSAQNRFGPSAFTWTSIPDNVDARRDRGDWTAVGFDDSAWEKAVMVDGKQWGPLRARHIPLLRETEVTPLRVVQRRDGSVAPHNLADKPAMARLLPIELASGSQIVVDAGRFVQAYMEIEMEASEGSQLEFEYAQTFYSTGNKPGGAQWAGVSRYTAKQGWQAFTSSDTFGCKYIVIRCAMGKVNLLGVKLVNRVYPFDVVGEFTSNDPLLNDIWRIGVNTILTGSEDAYVDCASRERTEWLGDGVMVSYPISRLTMAGPGLDSKPYWSDPRLFGSMLRHIGQSAQPDGRVKAHHPSDRWDIHGYIEDYACLWIHGLWMWCNNTGDLALVHEMWPAVNAQLKWFLDRRTERGLVKGREFVFPGNPLCYQVCEGATLNAAVGQAFIDAAELAQLLGENERQQQYADAGQAIREAINTHLWDQKTGTYCGSIKDGKPTPPTVHAAGICLYFDAVPADRRKRAEDWFLANIDKEECSPYQYAYFHEVLASMDSDIADLKALEVIRRRWAAMAQSESGTAWEGFGPSESCHDMGATPTMYLSRHVLGVQVDGPPAKHRLAIKPHLGDLKRVDGIVVTEFGPVPVCWDRSGADGRLKFDVEIPAGVKARVSLPRPADNVQLTIDGQTVKPASNSSKRFVTIELGEGKHSGR